MKTLIASVCLVSFVLAGCRPIIDVSGSNRNLAKMDRGLLDESLAEGQACFHKGYTRYVDILGCYNKAESKTVVLYRNGDLDILHNKLKWRMEIAQARDSGRITTQQAMQQLNKLHLDADAELKRRESLSQGPKPAVNKKVSQPRTQPHKTDYSGNLNFPD
ncbi:hypothetical protein WJT86_06120 [Microvirga sp. W0021]|uniref:Lipoprotein n=1 Tax=Hohaiivirga grylli TaxID=3133970 RepID=A0ABV0BIX7_9HYPH